MPKLSDLVEVWRSYNQNNFACFLDTVYVYWRPNDRPLISKNSNGHISATDHPIHFTFGSIVGFGDDGSNGAISGSNKSKMAAAAILEKLQMTISPQPVSSDPLHVWF